MRCKFKEFDDGEFNAVTLNAKTIKEEKEKARNKELWNLKNAGVYRAWNIIRDELLSQGVDEETAEKISRGDGTNIAIINSGIDYNHEDITERFTDNKGYNFVDNNNFPLDHRGHGTNIAGIVAGELTGVANRTTLYALKIGMYNDFSSARLQRAIKWCIDKKDIDLINLSLSEVLYNGELKKLCMNVHNRGSLIVASAGNRGSGASFPARFEEVVSVAAIDEQNYHCEFSTVWPTTDISAPGDIVFTIGQKTGNEGYESAYEKTKGTSVAVPLITGTFALAIAYLKHKEIKYTPKELKQLLKESAQPISETDKDIDYAKQLITGYGFDLINPSITPQEFLRWAYGAGIVRADNFIKEVKKFYS